MNKDHVKNFMAGIHHEENQQKANKPAAAPKKTQTPQTPEPKEEEKAGLDSLAKMLKIPEEKI